MQANYSSLSNETNVTRNSVRPSFSDSIFFVVTTVTTIGNQKKKRKKETFCPIPSLTCIITFIL